ncbi:hypothetical protein A2U01_0047693, partial [Trifolium medium]|nr:hypothetical protein [Trifolium medium]
FALSPEQLFVNKSFVENPALEAFKAEVKEELAAQRVKQEAMEAKMETVIAKQDDIGNDLKTILSLLQSKP